MSTSEHAMLAFDLARFQLTTQKEDLKNIRNQAAALAAASGLIATVFSSFAKAESLLAAPNYGNVLGFSLWFAVAITLMLISLIYFTRVIIGWTTCTFDLSPGFVLRKEKVGAPYDYVLRELAQDADKFFDGNEIVIKEAMANLRIGTYAVLAQVPVWLVVIRL